MDIGLPVFVAAGAHSETTNMIRQADRAGVDVSLWLYQSHAAVSGGSWRIEQWWGLMAGLVAGGNPAACPGHSMPAPMVTQATRSPLGEANLVVHAA